MSSCIVRELSEQDRVALKKIQLEMLQSLIKLCEQHNILYYAVGGTALGAIRHGGYIPWDDDIDIALPRSDYEKFLKFAEHELPDYMFAQTYMTETDYFLDFAKIRNTRTQYVEKSSVNRKINHGVYIDVFPIDGQPDGFPAKLLNIKKQLIKKAIACHLTLNPDFKRRFIYRTARIIVSILWAGKTDAELNAILDHNYRKYPYEQYDTVVCHGGAWGKLEQCPKRQYGKGTFVEFEGISVRIPELYDEYLTQKYHDYMQFPPVEKQKPHHDCVLFDPGVYGEITNDNEK